MAVAMPSFDFLANFWNQFFFIGKLLFYAGIGGAIIFVFLWFKGYKDIIIIREHHSTNIDKGKTVRKRDGTVRYKFFKAMFGKNISIPPPDDKLARHNRKGGRVFECIKIGENQYHFLKVPEDPKNLDKIEVVPSGLINWFIETDKTQRRKYESNKGLKEWLLPIAFIVFIVMVCVTLIYLFRELPRSIAVNVVQQSAPGFGLLIPFIKKKWHSI